LLLSLRGFFMPVDPLSEQVLSFSAAARRLPRLRGERPISPSTLWRWATHGLQGVRLEVCRVGGTSVTSEEALRRFFAALDDKPKSPIVPTAIRDHRAEQTAAELEAIGI
jgi:Protein of unknown function (DUF1580)